MQNYTFIRDGKPERVIPELWRWEATYIDGTVLKQFGDDGIFHQFGEIDQEKLTVFKMVSPDFPQVYSIAINPGEMKVIHYYKNLILGAGSPSEARVKIYVFGFEQKVFGHVAKSLFVITPSNELVCTNDINKLQFT